MPIAPEKRAEWRRLGLCEMCGHERAPSRSKCESCLEVNRRASRKYRPPSDETRAYYNEYRRRIRAEVLMHYGGKCTCCGETTIEFLELDHVNGGGRGHREQICGKSDLAGSAFYRKMRSLGYPDDVPLQVLCANCHAAKTYAGGCPHQR